MGCGCSNENCNGSEGTLEQVKPALTEGSKQAFKQDTPQIKKPFRNKIFSKVAVAIFLLIILAAGVGYFYYEHTAGIKADAYRQAIIDANNGLLQQLQSQGFIPLIANGKNYRLVIQDG